MTEYVYAVHDFTPEHEDEIAFKAGDRIQVVEKDDLYGDGWWQGRNLAGNVGLFPQAYTSVSAPLPEIRTPTTLQPLQEESSEDASAYAPSSEPAPAAETMPVNDTVMAATLTDVQEAIEQLAVRRDQDTDAARSFSFASTRDPETETDDETGDDADGQGWHKDARKALAERAEQENAKKLREEEAEANGYPPPPPQRQSLSAPPIAVELSDESDADEEDEAVLRNGHHDVHPHHHKYTNSTSTARAPDISLNDPPETEALQPAISLATSGVAHRASQSSLPTPTSPSSPHDASADITVVDPPTVAHPVPHTPTTATTARFHPSIAPPSHLANVSASLPSPAMSSTGGAALAMSVPLPKSPGPAVTNGNGALASPPAPPVPQVAPQPAGETVPQVAPQPAAQTVPRPVPHADPLTPPQTSDFGGSASAAESLRESLRRTHPSEWSMDQVVEWLKSKNVDDATCSKFIEHEITGDVLLELDVNILKEELNITAFGKRMRIANAIVELRRPASFSSDPAAFHNGYANVMSPPGIGDAHHQEASSVTSAEARSQMLLGTPGSQKNRPAQLVLSPSDGALNVKAQVTSAPSVPEEGEAGAIEERVVQSDTETAAGRVPAPTKRRHFLGRSTESGSSRGDKDKDSGSRQSNEVGSPFSSVPNSPGMRSDKTPPTTEEAVVATVGVGPRPHHMKGKRSTDGGAKAVDRLSFFSTTLGKSRKPPPRYSMMETDASAYSPPERSTRSITRLYLSSGSKKGGRPTTPGGPAKEERNGRESVDVSRDASILRKRNISTTSSAVPLPRPSRPAAVTTMPVQVGAKITLQPGLSVLDQIGRPDHAGWLRKKGERYNTWKLRYLVLKGPHLYYLRSNTRSETKIKGYIKVQGYKVIADENANPGKYGFRIIHDTEPSHYFSSEEQMIVREWMKALMKATIDRDYSKPVVSSCNIPTIPLTVAQAMNPAPRPPSPSARAATQKALRRENPNQLSSRDARVLMGLPASETGVLQPHDDRARLETFFDPIESEVVPTPAPAPPRPSRDMRHPSNRGHMDPEAEFELVDWANSVLPGQYHIHNLRADLSSGLVLLRLAEVIGGKPSEPPVPDAAFCNDNNLEGMFKLFDYMLDHDVQMGSVSINDVKQGRSDKILQLLRAIKAWGEKREAVVRSGGKGVGQAGLGPWMAVEPSTVRG